MEKDRRLSDKDIKLLYQMLDLSNIKQVIQAANYINPKTGKHGNTCSDYQNWFFNKFGIAFEQNLLSGEAKDITAEFFKKLNKDIQEQEAQNFTLETEE